MTISANSLAALDWPKLDRRSQQIYDWLVENGPATERVLKDELHYDDMNMIRPRITEMINPRRGQPVRIKIVDNVRCFFTRKTVRVLAAIPRHEWREVELMQQELL
jgi:hypothetical protein